MNGEILEAGLVIPSSQKIQTNPENVIWNHPASHSQGEQLLYVPLTFRKGHYLFIE